MYVLDQKNKKQRELVERSGGGRSCVFGGRPEERERVDSSSAGCI